MKKYAWQNELGNDFEKCDIEEEWGAYEVTNSAATTQPSLVETPAAGTTQPSLTETPAAAPVQAPAAERLEDVVEQSGVQLWNVGSTSVAVNPHLLRSAVFGHRSIVLDADREIATVEQPALLACGYLHRLTFIGPRWGQDHATVFFHLLSAMRSMRLGECLEIYPRRFAHRALGWSYSAYSYQKLVRALEDLSEGVIVRCWRGTYFAESAVRILRAPDLVRKKVRVSFDPSYGETMLDKPTYLSLTRRRELTVGVETWLYQFVRASSCDREMSLSRLRELFASSKSLGEFGRDVRAALKKLKELGLIENFNAERGRIQITKKVGMRT